MRMITPPPEIARAFALISFSALSALAAAPAQAVVIGFESLAQPNATYNFVRTEPYREGEFQVDRPAGNGRYPLAVWGTQADQYAGSTALFDGNALFSSPFSNGPSGQGEQVPSRLTKFVSSLPGRPALFSLLSIDVADINNTGESVAARFIGVKANGALVQQLFTTDNLKGLQTFTFSNDFTDLASVDWGNLGGFATGIQVDNICIDSGCPTRSTSVPEPFTALGTLFGAGSGVALKRKLARAKLDGEDIS
jgi:hypothetical protein